ncbi:hypothetical protein HC931_04900 [Candidatus Gracilibacteria bacterium]|nr:hypothetical protein [Candidatus Gracilibacteria bacterium]NJP19633.1 hypothetical protein [Hydrococcus sp. CRU_1_1]
MIKKSIANILTSSAVAIGMTVLNSGFAFSQTGVEPTTQPAPPTQTEAEPTTQPAPTQTEAKPATQPAPTKKISFVCATNSNPPTTYALTQEAQKQPTLKPLLTWHSEYLGPGESAEALCQKMAQELQNKYERGETPYFAYDLTALGQNSNQSKWRVCFVSSEGESCTTESEELFSLNSTYVPTCLADNKAPEACSPYIQKRGSLIKIPADRPWWTAFF